MTSLGSSPFAQGDEAHSAPRAPVALFVYNRAAQVERVLESLRRNDVRKLYIFSDGPKTRSDALAVDAVRRLVRAIDWTESEIVERNLNVGIRDSMRLGLERVFAKEDRIIVVEDDVAVAPEFCDFMNVCLEHYRNHDRVAGVTGLRYPFDRGVLDGYSHDVYLSPRFSSWGWGTWKRWWESADFDHDRVVQWLEATSDDELAAAGSDVPAIARHLVKGGTEWGATTADVYSLLHMIRNQQLFVWPTWNMIENLGLSAGTHVSSCTAPRWSLELEAKNDFDPRSLRLVDDLEPTAAVCEAFEVFVRSSMGLPDIKPSKSISDVARILAREITPPIVLRARSLVRCGLKRPALGFRSWRSSGAVWVKPDPRDYTTLDNPIEVAVQKETYYVALNECVEVGDRVLDVGCGLGYGLNLLSIKANEVTGVDVDPNAIAYCEAHVMNKNPKLAALDLYDGYHLPYGDHEFDVVTCVDVIEHVERYEAFIDELLRVARRRVVFGTPNRRAEFTNADGTPKNFWHLREWRYDELDQILRRHTSHIDWYFINGPWEGPHTVSRMPTDTTQALVPVLAPSAPLPGRNDSDGDSQPGLRHPARLA